VGKRQVKIKARCYIPSKFLVANWNIIMHCLLSRLHILRFILLITLLLLATSLITAQDELPAPQFLYRNENRLVLIDGYTGETTELPFEVTERDRFTWSLDGKYLLTRLQEPDKYTYCLNLYDVDTQEWVYNEPISCSVWDVALSPDSTQVMYITTDGINAILWSYNLESEARQELYRTTDGDTLRPSGLDDIQWSPTESYMTFVDYTQILGGTLNNLVVMNVENNTHFILYAPNTYYASYYPHWSADDAWFLVTLKEEYVTSGSMPQTNHRGDIYLVNSDTGAKYRLTYTSAAYETNLRWTEDGGITFTEVIEQTFTYTIEEAMNVEVVQREEIVTPEPFNDDIYFNSGSSDMLTSPDPELAAWVVETQGHQGNRIYELNFGTRLGRTIEFSIPLPDSYQYSYIIVGWRPSDYPYPQG
jgi:Tol biopolymer transport system component